MYRLILLNANEMAIYIDKQNMMLKDPAFHPCYLCCKVMFKTVSNAILYAVNTNKTEIGHPQNMSSHYTYKSLKYVVLDSLCGQLRMHNAYDVPLRFLHIFKKFN